MVSNFKIAIAGLGTVGSKVANLLLSSDKFLKNKSNKDFQLICVSARDKNLKRDFDITQVEWVDQTILLSERNDIDIIVELIGGENGIAYELVKNSLKNKKHVVTANKAMIAHHGHELAQIAEINKVNFLFESAVAGGVPILKVLKEGLVANKISNVLGILNGTSNYILSEMTKYNRSFDEVLKDAQNKGFAEADPSFDIDGIDAAHKLAILSSIAYEEEIDFASISVSGIRSISNLDISFANDLGYVIKLLAIANYSGFRTVQPSLISKDSQLAKISGALNAIEIFGNPIHSIMASGPGAGAGPTASAVISDLMDIINERTSNSFGLQTSKLKKISSVKFEENVSRYYFRIMVKDEVGVVSSISSVLKENNISIESMIQKSKSDNNPVSLVMTLHPTKFSKIKCLLNDLESLDFVFEKIVSLPILDFD